MRGSPAVGLGARLRRAGRTGFALLERADDVGGTWRDNVYPGVACDIPSALYSYSFLPQPAWSRVFAPGAEIHRYVREVARSEGLDQHLRLGTALTGARWHEDPAAWHLTTSTRSRWTARTLVTAVGRLSEPRVPDLPGLGTFPGRVFHSARWDRDLPAGLRVGVVGTGASAVQLVPELARRASSVVVLQRTPPWVLPRGDRAYAPGEPARAGRASRPGGRPVVRRAGGGHDGGGGAAGATGAPARPGAGPGAAGPAHPGLRGGLQAGAVQRRLVPGPAAAARHAGAERPGLGRGAGAGRGVRGAYEVDVLVLATGFETTRPPFAHLVAGRGGQTLAEHWADGMTSHASTAVHGFPTCSCWTAPTRGSATTPPSR